MIPFAKAHACGNDFLILDATHTAGADPADLARRLCHRHTGIGADGVEVLTAAGKQSATIRLFNADGSIAEISGNGTRCVAALLASRNHLAQGTAVRLETDAGPRACRIVSVEGPRYQITTAMGVPSVRVQSLTLASGFHVDGAVVSTGNPHFVLFVDDADFSIDRRSWQSIGSEICAHAAFPHQTNVEFVRILSRDAIAIRIYERGVGPTSSSGTGTCAAAAAAIAVRGEASTLTVEAPGGAQIVGWGGGESEMLLTGPAELIAFGDCF